LIRDPQQFRLDAHQAGAILALLFELVNMLDAGDELLAIDHAIELFQLGKKVGTAELDFFAGSTGTKGVCVKSHGGEFSLENWSENNFRKKRCWAAFVALLCQEG
jgi:hypothetical protein